MSEQRVSRRTLLAGAAAAGGLAATSPTRAQAARTITVATWGGLYEKTLRSLLPEFERQHDVTVRLLLGLGSTQMPKLVASRGAPPFSVLYLNDDEAIFGEKAGLWAADQSGPIPNVGHLYANCRPPALPMYGLVVYELPLAYNPDKMPAPTSWKDLWRPGLTVGVPDISDSYGMTFLYIAALLNGGDENNLQPGFDAIKRLPRYKIYHGVTQGFSMFQQGEIDAALYYGHRARQLQDAGVKLAIAHPSEGVWGLRAGVQIPKGVSGSELGLARAYVDFATSAAYQRAFADLLYSPSNRTVDLPPELAAKHVYGEAAVTALRFPPWPALIAQRDAVLDRWSREIAG